MNSELKVTQGVPYYTSTNVAPTNESQNPRNVVSYSNVVATQEGHKIKPDLPSKIFSTLFVKNLQSGGKTVTKL